jgi:hypothetical protein
MAQESPPQPPYEPMLQADPVERVAVQEPSVPTPGPKIQTEATPEAAKLHASHSQGQDVATLIQASRAAYQDNCACPYDRDSAGRKCGRRSA